MQTNDSQAESLGDGGWGGGGGGGGGGWGADHAYIAVYCVL